MASKTLVNDLTQRQACSLIFVQNPELLHGYLFFILFLNGTRYTPDKYGSLKIIISLLVQGLWD